MPRAVRKAGLPCEVFAGGATIEAPRIVHHRRQSSGDIATEVFTSGDIVLDPPGLTLVFADFCAD